MKKIILLMVLGLCWTLTYAQNENKHERDEIRKVEKGGGGSGIFEPMLDVDNFNDRVFSAYIRNGVTGIDTDTYALYVEATKSDTQAVHGVYSYVYNDEQTKPADSYAGYFDNNSFGMGASYGVYARSGVSSNVPVGYGLYATAFGATTNWAGYFDQGNVYIGGELQTQNVLRMANWDIFSDPSTYNLSETNVGTHLSIKAGGNIGVGTTSPENELHVSHGTFGAVNTNNGLKIQNGTGNKWTLYTYAGSGELGLFFDSDLRGAFDDVTGNYNPVSDKRFKKNIETIDSVLPSILALSPKRYHMKTNDDNDAKTYGFIAQEVKEIFPEFVNTVGSSDSEGGLYHTVNYSSFSVLTIKAIQEQQQMIKDIKTENTELKTEVATLKNRLAQLEAAVETLKRE